MSETDFKIVNSKIDGYREFLNDINRDIWKTPELALQEVKAHALLTESLESHGFQVFKQYYLPTAFRAEYSSKSVKGKTIAILLEYDALPEIGHACGHNLIAEAGLAAAIGAKAAMEKDSTIIGKLVILGTPAEERDGGKIKLIEFGAFDDIDAAIMVHPAPYTVLDFSSLCCLKGSAHFKGKESHAGSRPWEGINALDAAVACYQSVALLRQQIHPTSRINVIISNSGSAVNVIPAESSMEFLIRTLTVGENKALISKIKRCIHGAADATGCEVSYSFPENECYKNMITNKVILTAFEGYLNQLGYDTNYPPIEPGASTDMGNVSHKIPSIQPLYAIPTDGANHTPGFTVAAGDDTAQQPTLIMGKAMAMTALHLLRNPNAVEDARKQLVQELPNDSNTST